MSCARSRTKASPWLPAICWRVIVFVIGENRSFVWIVPDLFFQSQSTFRLPTSDCNRAGKRPFFIDGKKGKNYHLCGGTAILRRSPPSARAHHVITSTRCQ